MAVVGSMKPSTNQLNVTLKYKTKQTKSKMTRQQDQDEYPQKGGGGKILMSKVSIKLYTTMM